MIRHAWTVVCEKTIVDRETNNISLDAVEQLGFAGIPSLPPDAQGLLLPCRIDVVSLWYRDELAQAARGKSRMRVLAPNGEAVAGGETDVDLTTFVRARTLSRLAALPVPVGASRGGRFMFIIELEQSNDWVEVARVPLEVEVVALGDAAPGPAPSSH